MCQSVGHRTRRATYYLRMPPMSESTTELDADVASLDRILTEMLRTREGTSSATMLGELRRAAAQLRAGELPGGRATLAARIEALDLDALELVAHSTTLMFHLVNSAEEQHRIRVLRRRDRGEPAPEGSLASLPLQLARAGVGADEARALLARLFIMPVLTAHPTEARRQTVLDHLAAVAAGLDRLDDPRT
ncbi:MAG TPA: phosphoenolpyruvate carboxylase, partial [Polyangia bacterium]|nr:phosphoenolpyruvate carboxylase [Polyangia bacterium]